MRTLRNKRKAKFRIGQKVQVIRKKEEGMGKKDYEIAKMPKNGVIIYIGEHFVTADMYAEDGRFLYRESFWLNEVTI